MNHQCEIQKEKFFSLLSESYTIFIAQYCYVRLNNIDVILSFRTFFLYFSYNKFKFSNKNNKFFI